jgi:hypothetical protein
MRIPLLSFIVKSPFDEGMNEHSEKVKECTWAFQQAVECFLSDQCVSFEKHRQELIKVKSEADAIKRRIRGHFPRLRIMPINKYQLLMYLKEEDKILNAIERSLEWLSRKADPGIPESLKKDIFLLVDSIIEPIEELSNMVTDAGRYFMNYSEKKRGKIKSSANSLREKKAEADRIGSDFTSKIFTLDSDPVTILYMVKLVELIGSIAGHAENAGDMMQAMLA